ncbi:hypothetical protein AGMMS50230_02010 [Spirochaetia bacterium]|nr:hypothetical protein AGMMS50230_02010 [Spirochaetia bacterium]
MNKIYYFPRWKAIIIGVIYITIGISCVLLMFIFNNINGIMDILNSISPKIEHGIVSFICEILTRLFLLVFIINGITFIIRSKRVKLIEFRDNEMLYQYQDINKRKFMSYSWGTTYQRRIYFKDIIDINIINNNTQKVFKIKTKDGINHDLPFSFHIKDKDDIIEYIKERINNKT